MLFSWFGTGTQDGAQHPAWVTVTDFGLPEVAVGAVTVIVATREVLLGFAVQVAVMVPFPDPEAGAIVHQAWLLTAVQAHCAVTVKAADPPELGIF